MSTPYTVQRGDTLTKIAIRHGFRNWRVIYDHPDNAGFKRLRPNPNLIYPGDVIQIPASGSLAHPGLTPGPPDPKVGMECCTLATHTECPYSGGDKSLYTCPPGYVKQFWPCMSGTRMLGCGECCKSPSTNCFESSGDFLCSIWWYIS